MDYATNQVIATSGQVDWGLVSLAVVCLVLVSVFFFKK